jgi:hypothetical protein
MRIVLRATYTEYDWPKEGDEDYDEGDNYPRITGGYTQVHNPWGGLDSEVPEGVCGEAFTAWRDEHADSMEFDDAYPDTLDDGEWVYAFEGDENPTWRTFTALEHAAAFIAEFEGGVWDLWESEPSTDFRTGISREVTLHVEAEADTFTRALLRGTNDKALSALLDPLPLVLNLAQRSRDDRDAHLRALAERNVA